jgi:P27 family predicted phage terminase small subunit
MSHKVPTHLKLLRGNPGKRPLPASEPKPELPPKPPEPPDFLDSGAVEEWRRLAPELWSLGLLTRLDVGHLAGYCYSYSQWKTAATTLRQMGVNDPVMHGQLVKSGEGGGASPNPLIWVARSALRDMIRIGAEFGFSPASRSSISAGEDPDLARSPASWRGKV